MTALQPSPTIGYLSGRPLLAAFGGIGIGIFLVAIDETIVSTALPTIAGDLGGFGGISWVFTMYLLVETVSIPMWGRLGDLRGRRPMFRVAMLVFLLGSLVAAAATSMPLLVAGRGIQGLGGGGLFTLAVTLVADLVEPERRPRYQGLIAAVFTAASLAGPPVGGVLVEHASWRLAFLVNVPLTAVAWVVTARALPHRAPTGTGHFDAAGGVALAVGLASLLGTTVTGPSRGWTDPLTIGLAVGGTAVLVGWARHQARSTSPVVPRHLLSNRLYRRIVATSVLCSACIYAPSLFVPVFLQLSWGRNPTTAGFLLLPISVGTVTLSVLTGRVVTRTRRYRPFLVGGISCLVAGFALLATLDAEPRPAVLLVALALVGVGVGMAMPLLILMAQQSTDFRDIGAVTSVTLLLRQVGGVVAVAVFGALLSTSVASHLTRNDAALPPDVSHQELLDTPERVADLPAEARTVVREGVAGGVHGIFLGQVALALLALGAALAVGDLRLRQPPLAPAQVAGPPSPA